MNWAAPDNAWLVLLVVPLAGLLCWAVLRKRRDLVRLSSSGEPRALPLAAWMLVAAALMLVVVALCRPQWGQETVRQDRRGVDILVALDVSRSMLADDQSPTRLAAAKQAVYGLVGQLQGERIGLIAFAGSAFLVCPLTTDYGSFAVVLGDAGPDTIPASGSSLSAAMVEAQRAFGASAGEARRVLVVLSDGEDHGGEGIDEAAAALKEAGVTVDAVAVGTAAGGPIRLGSGDFVKDRDGALVRTRMHAETLDRLAVAAGTRRHDLGPEPGTLAALYRQELASATTVAIDASRQQLVERYQWPLAIALLLLLIEPLVGRRARI